MDSEFKLTGFQDFKIAINKEAMEKAACFVEAFFELDKGRRFALLVGDISEPAQGAPIDRR